MSTDSTEVHIPVHVHRSSDKTHAVLDGALSMGNPLLLVL